jgi:hypothetical protein
MKYSRLVLIICGIALGVGVALSMQSRNALISTPALSSAITYSKATAGLITVTSPLPGSTVPKVFKIMGSARGAWYFEASFPVKVVGKSGEILAQLPASAKGEWMTEDFVPFVAEIKIPATYSGPATLILSKDNPSGLPEHDASISFNVVIK